MKDYRTSFLVVTGLLLVGMIAAIVFNCISKLGYEWAETVTYGIVMGYITATIFGGLAMFGRTVLRK